MSDYLYVPGSGLEIPGVEAVLEYGDASTYQNGGIPGALQINDRSMPDQVRVSEISGLHDSPDAADSRTERAVRFGERAGIQKPNGRTIGITGHVRAGNVHRMRDLWRMLRAQFGREEQDLVIHTPGEAPGYVNNAPGLLSTSTWSGSQQSAGGTQVPLAAFTDGNLQGFQFGVTSLPATNQISIGASAVRALTTPWDGQDVWVTAIVAAQAAAATPVRIKIGIGLWWAQPTFTAFTGNLYATGAGVITSPAVGTYYLLAARLTDIMPLVADVTHLTPIVAMDTPATTGTYTLRAAKLGLVLLDVDEPTPAGFFDGSTPGFEWEGTAGLSKSYGPTHTVNQIADPDMTSGASWSNASSSGATVDTAGLIVRSWPGNHKASLEWKVRNPNTTSRTLAIKTPGTLADPNLFVVEGGRSYRVHLRALTKELFTVGLIDVVWLDKSGAVIDSSMVAAMDSVGVGGVSVDAEYDSVVVAPALAMRAYLKISSLTSSTTANDRLWVLITQPLFVDVSEHDPDVVEINRNQPPEIGLATYEPTTSGGSFIPTPSGARRRIPRPFLLQKVRALSDAKAPESQRGLTARRDFTMSMRANDPRIYGLDEHHDQVKASGSPLVTAPMNPFAALLSTPGAVAASDDFFSTVAAAALDGRTAPVGGTWATSGDATDFVFGDAFGTEQLTRISGTSTNGRYAILGTTTFTNVVVVAAVAVGSFDDTLDFTTQSVVARYTDASNHVRAQIKFMGSGDASLELHQVLAGVLTSSTVAFAEGYIPGSYYRILLTVYANGRVVAQAFSPSSDLLAQTELTNAAMASGGALASGKVGLRDFMSGPATTRYYDDFVARPLYAVDPFGAPTGFTSEGTSLDSKVSWVTSVRSTNFQRNGIGLGIYADDYLSHADDYLAQDSVARMYRSLEGYTYTTPQVTVVGDVISSSGRGSYYDLFADSYLGSVWQYNYIAALLKRVNSTTWIELRYNSANSVAMTPYGTSPPRSLELWSSHNTSGSLATTRLNSWDVPVGEIISGKIKHVRSYMTSSNVVYSELWSSEPNLNDTGLIFRAAYTLPSGLAAVVGASVAGQSGAAVKLGRWAASSSVGIDRVAMEASYGYPYLASYEAIDYSSSLIMIACPVIGDVDDVPWRLKLLGDLENPIITLISDGLVKRSSVLRLAGVFSDADPVTIDFDAGTIRSDSGVNYFSRRLVGSTFANLTAGQNYVVIQATDWDSAAAVHAIASWRDALK